MCLECLAWRGLQGRCSIRRQWAGQGAQSSSCPAGGRGRCQGGQLAPAGTLARTALDASAKSHRIRQLRAEETRRILPLRLTTAVSHLIPGGASLPCASAVPVLQPLRLPPHPPSAAPISTSPTTSSSVSLSLLPALPPFSPPASPPLLHIHIDLEPPFSIPPRHAPLLSLSLSFPLVCSPFFFSCFAGSLDSLTTLDRLASPPMVACIFMTQPRYLVCFLSCRLAISGDACSVPFCR